MKTVNSNSLNSVKEKPLYLIKVMASSYELQDYVDEQCANGYRLVDIKTTTVGNPQRAEYLIIMKLSDEPYSNPMITPYDSSKEIHEPGPHIWPNPWPNPMIGDQPEPTWREVNCNDPVTFN